MLFSSVPALVTVLAGLAQTQFTSQAVANALDNLRVRTATLILPAQQMTAENARQLQTRQGPWTAVVYGLNDVDSNTDTLIETLQLTAPTFTKTPYTGPDAAAIGSQFQNFVNVQLELLNLLSTKAYALNMYNAPYVSRPFTIVLQVLKTSVDLRAFPPADSVGAVQRSSNLGTLDAQYSAVIPLFSRIGG
ncbi:hypothetical protein B0T24DRAFT_207896 [Lasiosphaeria ovina]|uniref:Uncharacterized protein n=1 Tax=Lasiosphaeria ovina TaxID=92902 RepID=A0AAE0KHE5_9PEZI|nr:hypothetical protein B0T24DRAFT_207896 [Lasiosphaeria ovina]